MSVISRFLRVILTVYVCSSLSACTRAADSVAVLESDAPVSDLARAARDYRQRGGQGLTMQNSLRSKHAAEQVDAVLEAFAPERLRVVDLLPLFVWLDQHPEEARRSVALRRLRGVAAERTQLEALAKTNSPSAKAFAQQSEAARGVASD